MKKNIYENYRVVIPIEDGRWTQKTATEFKMDAEKLIASIKKHCDVVGQYECDVREICEFCGSDWKSSINEEGCPICCNEALQEWEAFAQKRG